MICSAANIELCRSLGADAIIDYTKADILFGLKKMGQVFDLAVDNIGSPSDFYERSDTFLKSSGMFMLVRVNLSLSGFGVVLSRLMRPRFLGGKNRAFHFVRNTSSRDDFTQIGKWMVEGEVKAVIDGVFEWEDVPKAYEKLRTGYTKGEIIVHVAEK